jgi:hypothetical protein
LLSPEHSISKTLQFSKLGIKFINVLAQNSSAIAITHGTPLNYLASKGMVGRKKRGHRG